MPLAAAVSAPLIGGKYGPHQGGLYLPIPGWAQRRQNVRCTRPYPPYLGIAANADFLPVAEYGSGMGSGMAAPDSRQAGTAPHNTGTGEQKCTANR